jgi:uncharacterized Rmd1/YagE family protein
MRCIAYCTAEQYNLKKLAQFFEDQGSKSKLYNKEVLHVSKYKEGSDIFFFDYGCVVFWDYSKKLENQIIGQIEGFGEGPISTLESDEFSYQIAKNIPKTTIQNDEIKLSSNRIFEKLTISFGLSQSVKLETFEQTLERTVKQTKSLPENLANHGKIDLSRRQISKKMGRLFLVRNDINLHTEILGMPDFFWEYPEYESLYTMVIKNLDVPQRAEILNRRLDMIQELLSMLGDELNHRHSSKLEWVIIILISVEVGLVVVKEILHLI